MEKARDKTAVIVKMNMTDGFSGGMGHQEALEVAKCLEKKGVHGLVLSGGFVSKAPMYIMKGSMPIKTLANNMSNPLLKMFTKLMGKSMIPDDRFKENYFLDKALKFRDLLKLPLIYVGGILSYENITQVLDHGFNAVAIARALIQNPNFINEMQKEAPPSSCDTCNHCIAIMYNGPFECIQHHKLNT